MATPNIPTPSRPRLITLPLEPYQARYTEMLVSWERRVFGESFSIAELVPDGYDWTPASITTGEVLDAVRRPSWALRQMDQLLKQAPTIGRVWFSDFYHSGLDALPYSRSTYDAYSFLWAQSFDQHDFTRKFVNWMRPWEAMAFDVYSGVFVASSLLADLIVTALPYVENKVFVVGLPFNSQNVFSRFKGAVPDRGAYDVVYSSRFDTEKNPSFFLDLVEQCHDLSFAICTGHSELRGSDAKAVQRAKQLHKAGRLNLFENCSKESYYSVLLSSKVQFNCASQDWVSFTLLEALTFGCLPLYPMHRSFPEALFHQADYMYAPDDLREAEIQLRTLLDSDYEDHKNFTQAVVDYHNGTLHRIANIIKQ